MDTEVNTDKAKRYLNDAKARERIEDSEYERMLNKPMFKKYKRDLKLHARIENVRDDTLDNILKRSRY
jgi:hypothetical protein